MNISNSFIPIIVFLIVAFGTFKKIKVFEAFTDGATEGAAVILKIIPPIFAIMLAIEMFSASGALEAVSNLFSPITSAFGIPQEVTSLMIIRPISGAGALAMFKDILTDYGPDSFIGRVASVMQSSTETTFFAIAMYYSSTRATKTKHTLFAALCGDFTGFVLSVITVLIFLY